MKTSYLHAFGILLIGSVIVGCSSASVPSETTIPVPEISSPEIVVEVAESVIEEVIEAPEPVIEAVALEPDFGPILETAISGYDPVSYFKDGPKLGVKNLHATHDGVTYYFTSSENRDEFWAEPSRYIPAYGGWCAYAVAKNKTLVEVNPETYKIIDGKLNLFYNKNFINTLSLWNLNSESLNAKAKTNWADLTAQGKTSINAE